MKYYITQEGVNFLNETHIRSAKNRLKGYIKAGEPAPAVIKKMGPNVGIRDPEGTIKNAAYSYAHAGQHSLRRTGGGSAARTHKDPWVRMATADPRLRQDRAAHLGMKFVQGVPTRFSRDRGEKRPKHTGEMDAPFWGTGEEAAFHKKRISAALATIKKSRLLRSVRDAQPHSRRNR